MLPGKTFNVPFVLQMVRRRIWWLVIPPVVGLFASLVVSAWLSNLYQSDVLVSIIPQRVPDSFVRTTVTLRTEERLSAIQTQVTSRTLLEQLINEYDLYAVERQRLPMEDVIALMRKNIDLETVAPRRGPRGPEPLHAFHVRFNYTDAQVAARIAQRLGQMFVDQNARDRGALAAATNLFLEKHLAEAVAELEKTERRLEAFRERHGSELPTQLQSNMTAIQSTQMQVQALAESVARDRDRKLMLERLHNEAVAETRTIASPFQQQSPNQPTDPGRTVAGSPEQQLAAARITLSNLELRLKPEHPDVRRAKRVIRELEQQVKATPASETTAAPVTVTAEEMRRVEELRQQRAEIESLDRQIAFKDAEEKRYRAVIAEYQRRIEAVPGVESEWIALTRDYNTRKEAYEELLKKSEEARVAVDLERRQIGEQFRIVDAAATPTRPISPVRWQINGIGLAIGLLLGLGVAAFAEVRDGSLRTEGDILDVLKLPVLAIVPYVQTAQEGARRVRKLAFVSGTAIVAVGAAGYVFWTMRLWNFLL